MACSYFTFSSFSSKSNDFSVTKVFSFSTADTKLLFRFFRNRLRLRHLIRCTSSRLPLNLSVFKLKEGQLERWFSIRLRVAFRFTISSWRFRRIYQLDTFMGSGNTRTDICYIPLSGKCTFRATDIGPGSHVPLYGVYPFYVGDFMRWEQSWNVIV